MPPILMIAIGVSSGIWRSLQGRPGKIVYFHENFGGYGENFCTKAVSFP
jgi:hypothetical protein